MLCLILLIIKQKIWLKNYNVLKGKTKLNLCKNISNYYDEMKIRRQKTTFQFEEDHFSENVQGIGKIYHEILLILKFLQTKPKVKGMNID